ncbi:MAG: hypothetical protein ACKVZJ_01885 [Phycisphaerales bacterium]
MKLAQTLKHLAPMGLLAAASVVLAATPTMDGTRDASYGLTPLTSQKASVIDITLGTLTASGQSNQSNLGGVVTFAGSTFTYPAPDSDPALVTTGVEFAVDLSEIQWDGSSPIRIAGWQIRDGTGNTVSNQVFGGLPANTGNVGAPTTTNWNSITGDQFVTIPAGAINTAATVDGTKDASYPAALFVNTLASTLGNTTTASQNNANGTELCAVYGYRSATRLYVIVTGNLRTQFDKVVLWVDCKAGGQNIVRADNAGIDFGVINAHAGMTFDNSPTVLEPDYFINYTGGSGGDHYMNYATLPTGGSGAGGYTRGDKNTPPGEFRILSFPGQPTTNGQSPPPNGGRMEAASNNSNLGGIAGAIVQPNPWTVPPGTNPGTVNTGAEIRIPLAETGWTAGTTSVRLGGFIVGFNWDFLSNQVVGGVPATQDNYGFPANGVDFSSPLNAGNQFVTLTVPGTLATRTIVLDGTRDAGQYSLGWINNVPANSGNPTGFGDSTSGTVDQSNGSELNNVFVSFGLDPANANAPTMWIFAGGNLHDNNKLCFFVDAKAGGQNQFVAGNPTFGINRLGPDTNGPGLKWDAGFEPDYMVAYAAGLSSGTPIHSLFASTLPTTGGGIGGEAASATKAGVTPVLTGTYRARNGFGNNTDATVARANGSELNNIYAQRGISPVDGSDLLYLFIGGNLETNANKLEIFADVTANTGQNTLIYDDPANGYTGNPDVDFFALNRMGGPFTPTTGPVQPGLTFDSGFTADYYWTINTSGVNAAGTSASIFGNYARLKGVNGPADDGIDRYLGTTTTGNFGALDGGDLLTNELTLITIDNSNLGGVAGGANAFFTPTTDPATVNKGIEIGIPIADLAPWNGTTGSIKMMLFVNGQAHDFASNQVLGPYCGNDLGEPRNINFTTIPGNQFFELVYNAGTQTYTNAVAQIAVCTPPPPPSCKGDLNNDGLRNTADLTGFLGAFGSTVPPQNPNADFNNDGFVNTQDLTSFLGVFGVPCPPAP